MAKKRKFSRAAMVPPTMMPAFLARKKMERAGSTTVGSKTANTEKHCGCHLAKNKRGGNVIKCPGTNVQRFISKETARSLARPSVKGICAFLLRPFTKGDPRLAKMRARRKAYSFRTSHGKTINLKRRPRIGYAKKMTAFYYSQLRKRMAKRGFKVRHQPSFARWR
jgi:hypothetical protein